MHVPEARGDQVKLKSIQIVKNPKIFKLLIFTF